MKPLILSLLCAVLLLGGCANERTRANMRKADVNRIVPGKSTRATVMLAFGEPDRCNSDGSVCSYDWARDWVQSDGGSGIFGFDYAIVVRYDARGVVRSREQRQASDFFDNENRAAP